MAGKFEDRVWLAADRERPLLAWSTELGELRTYQSIPKPMADRVDDEAVHLHETK